MSEHRLLTCNWSIYRVRCHSKIAFYEAIRDQRPFSLVRFPTILS